VNVTTGEGEGKNIGNLSTKITHRGPGGIAANIEAYGKIVLLNVQKRRRKNRTLSGSVSRY